MYEARELVEDDIRRALDHVMHKAHEVQEHVDHEARQAESR